MQIHNAVTKLQDCLVDEATVNSIPAGLHAMNLNGDIAVHNTGVTACTGEIAQKNRHAVLRLDGPCPSVRH